MKLLGQFGDHPVERDQQVTVKPIIILLFCRAIAQIRHLGKPPASGHAGQYTDGQGATIHQTHGVRRRAQVDQQMPMQPLFDDPEIGRLLGKRGSRSESWKPRRPMTTEILPDAHIGIQTQKLTHHLQGDHFAVRQLRGKATLAQAMIPQQGFQVFFYPAKHRDDKVFKRHGGLSVRLRWLVPLSLARTVMPHPLALSLLSPFEKSNIAFI
jgi:hypothetical protein